MVIEVKMHLRNLKDSLASRALALYVIQKDLNPTHPLNSMHLNPCIQYGPTSIVRSDS